LVEGTVCCPDPTLYSFAPVPKFWIRHCLETEVESEHKHPFGTVCLPVCGDVLKPSTVVRIISALINQASINQWFIFITLL